MERLGGNGSCLGLTGMGQVPHIVSQIWLADTFCSPGTPGPHEGGVQVPRRVRLLRGAYLLEGHAPLPQGGQRPEGEV